MSFAPIFGGFGSGGTIGGSPFTPADLFAFGENGGWWDVKDAGTVWADTAGTTPATLGGTAKRLDDKSGNGRHLTNPAGVSYTIDPRGVPQFTNAGFLMGNTASACPCATVVCAAQVNNASGTWAGLVTNDIDQGTDVDFALVRNSGNSLWTISQGAGEGLSTSSRIWRDKTQTTAITLAAPHVYSCDGTGHPGALQFPSGIRLFNDRGLAGRDVSGGFWGLVVIDRILSTAEREQLIDWMLARYEFP